MVEKRRPNFFFHHHHFFNYPSRALLIWLLFDWFHRLLRENIQREHTTTCRAAPEIVWLHSSCQALTTAGSGQTDCANLRNLVCLAATFVTLSHTLRIPRCEIITVAFETLSKRMSHSSKFKVNQETHSNIVFQSSKFSFLPVRLSRLAVTGANENLNPRNM